MIKRLEHYIKHNKFAQKAYKVILGSIIRFAGLFIKKDHQLVLFTGLAGGYNDSPREIYEYMMEKHPDSGYKYVWALNQPKDITIKGCKLIKLDSIEYFITAIKAKYWIACVNIERGLNFKKRETRYLNTWHGIPMKTIGNAVPGRNDYDFSNVDIFCCSGNYDRNIMLKDLCIDENCLYKIGMPRNDKLFKKEFSITEIKRKIGIPNEKKVILYAPTWRDSLDFNKACTIDPRIDFEKWAKCFNQEYVMLIRTHAYSKEIELVGLNDFIIDVTHYENINELFYLADILISDYSSVIFDYAILEKPIICYAYDYDEYRKSRGLYLDLQKDLPNGIFKTEDEVIRHIQNIDYQDQCNRTAKFKNAYIEVKGNATEICSELLFGIAQEGIKG